MTSLGTIFHPGLAPETLLPMARATEDAGLDQLWIWEDCFREGGIAQAAAALGATSRIQVGIGVLPVPLRNVALTAMELATLERIHPGRLVAGIGHGVQDWMGQVGARPASPLTLLREYTGALRRLLDGETVTTSGEYVRLDDVGLSWPPASRLPLHLAGEGPRTLDLVGEVGDGLVVPGGYTTDRLRTVLERVHRAADAAGRPHPTVTMFLPCAFGADAEQAVTLHRERVEIPADAPATEVWGAPDEVAAGVTDYAAAGADAVALLPVGDADLKEFTAAAGRVKALLDA